VHSPVGAASQGGGIVEGSSVPRSGCLGATDVVWIPIAFWPARVAAREGHSFFGYFLFNIVFFPAALLVAYMVSDRTTADVA
jgi:hypothetical protein